MIKTFIGPSVSWTNIHKYTSFIHIGIHKYLYIFVHIIYFIFTYIGLHLGFYIMFGYSNVHNIRPIDVERIFTYYDTKHIPLCILYVGLYVYYYTNNIIERKINISNIYIAVIYIGRNTKYFSTIHIGLHKIEYIH